MQSPPPPSSALALISISSSSSDSDSESGEPQGQQPRRGVRRTQKLVDNSQIAKEVAVVRSKGKGKSHKLGMKALSAAVEMS
jgi:hypothetical protein